MRLPNVVVFVAIVVLGVGVELSHTVTVPVAPSFLVENGGRWLVAEPLVAGVPAEVVVGVSHRSAPLISQNKEYRPINSAESHDGSQQLRKIKLWSVHHQPQADCQQHLDSDFEECAHLVFPPSNRSPAAAHVARHDFNVGVSSWPLGADAGFAIATAGRADLVVRALDARLGAKRPSWIDVNPSWHVNDGIAGLSGVAHRSAPHRLQPPFALLRMLPTQSGDDSLTRALTIVNVVGRLADLSETVSWRSAVTTKNSHTVDTVCRNAGPAKSLSVAHGSLLLQSSDELVRVGGKLLAFDVPQLIASALGRCDVSHRSLEQLDGFVALSPNLLKTDKSSAQYFQRIWVVHVPTLHPTSVRVKHQGVPV